MTEKKDSAFKKVMGLFVETEEGAEPPRPQTPVPPRSAPRSSPPVPPARGSRPSQPAAPVQSSGAAPQGGGMRFSVVYDRAGIDAGRQERVTKALALLETLPASAPAETKRQIVEAALNAFGFPVDEIVSAGEAEVAALDGFVATANEETESRLAASRARIDEINAEIASVKKSMEDVMATQTRLVEATNRERERVHEVLAFFAAKG